MTSGLSDHRHIRTVLDERWTLSRKTSIALEIIPTYIRARRLLARREFPDALARLRERKERSGLPTLDQQLVGVRLGRAVEQTLRRLPTDSRCLIKSLVLTRLLARRGIHADFVIGVRSEDGFQAHAWLEKDGVALIDDGGGAYARLTEL
jgi:hypothetical protein